MRVLRMAVLVSMVLFLAVGVSYAQATREYYNKGLEYGVQIKFEEAEKEFKKALESDQSFEPAKEGLKVIEDVLGKKVKDATAVYLFKGEAYSNKGMFDEAIAEYKRAIAVDSNYAKVHHKLGVAYGSKLKFDEAIAEYERAIAIDPNLVNAYNDLGVAYGSKGKFDEAIVEGNKAIAINPNFAEAHYNLAIVYYQKGQYGLAIEHCDRALELGYKSEPSFLESLKPHRKK